MDADRTLGATVGWALPVVAAWAMLAALWNFGGAGQLERGMRSLGPTASVLASLVLLVMPAGIAVAVRHRPTVFVVLVAVVGLAAPVAWVGAFLQDPSLWPSESWQRAGVLLSGVGLVAAAAAIAAFFRWRPIADPDAGRVTKGRVSSCI